MERNGNLTTYVWLSAIIVLLGQTIAPPEAVDINDITRLCPYSKFCTSGPKETMPSCCLPCFCSKFCWARDDCCFDVEVAEPANIGQLQGAVECVSQSHKFVDGQRIPVHTANTTYMWMVTKCVGPASSHPLAEKCQLSPDSSIVDLIPAWSPSTGDLYRNYYCAICYDVTDYEFLTVDIGDLNGYQNVEANVNWEIIDYLVRHSGSPDNVLTVRPSNVSRTGIPYCNLTYTSECPNVANMPDIILHKCADPSDTHMYVSEVLDKKVPVQTNTTVQIQPELYKNVYCYICNSVNWLPGDRLYDAYNETHAVRYPNVTDVCIGSILLQSSSGSSTTPTFMELLSFDGTVQYNRMECDKTDILDAYMKKCRQLVCPELSLPYNGECYYTQGYSTPRTMSFLVTAYTSRYLSPDATNRLVVNRLLSWSSSSDTEFFCSIESGFNNSQSNTEPVSRDYFISIGFQDEKMATNNFELVRNVHRFMFADLQLGFNITGKVLKGTDARAFQFDEIWHSDDFSRQCTGSFKVIQLWCPTIELSDDDFRYCVTHGILPEDYEFNIPSTQTGNQSVGRYICVRDYLHAWVSVSRASRRDTWTPLWFLYVLAISPLNI